MKPNAIGIRGNLVWILLLALVLPTGCGGSSGSARPFYYYTIDYPAAVKTFSPALPTVLRVDRFSAAPPFNSPAIVYADKGLHRNAYASHQWIAPPGEVLAFVLARDLRHSGGFQGVLPPDATTYATHVVNGWLEECLEVDRPEGWTAVLSLHITVSAAREPDLSRRVLLQKSYRTTSPTTEKTPAALAEAMSRAAAQASSAIVEDIYRKLGEAL